MEFRKQFMSLSELIRDGIPESYLLTIWNTPHQSIAFKSGAYKQSKIIFDTKQLNALIKEEREKDQAKRGVI